MLGIGGGPQEGRPEGVQGPGHSMGGSMGTGVDGSPHSPGPRDSGDFFSPPW